MTRPTFPSSQPATPVSAPQTQPAPAEAVPVTVPPAPPASEELPDHLNFTAGLDLRGLRDDAERDGEQNVGPTR